MSLDLARIEAQDLQSVERSRTGQGDVGLTWKRIRARVRNYSRLWENWAEGAQAGERERRTFLKDPAEVDLDARDRLSLRLVDAVRMYSSSAQVK